MELENQIIMGKAVQGLSEDKLWTYAGKISGALAEHCSTMVQFTPDKILEAMNQGRAVLYLGVKAELFGFGQIWSYGQNTYEFGSWLSFEKGAGRVVLTAARDLSMNLFPEAQLVALVEPENISAQTVIEQLGVQPELATSHLLVKGPTLMKKYDITKRVLI